MTSSPSEPRVWFVLCLSSLSATASSSLASWSSSAFDSFLRAMMEAYKGQVIDIYKHDKSMENMRKWKSWKKTKHFSYDTHWEQNKDHCVQSLTFQMKNIFLFPLLNLFRNRWTKGWMIVQYTSLEWKTLRIWVFWNKHRVRVRYFAFRPILWSICMFYAHLCKLHLLSNQSFLQLCYEYNSVVPFVDSERSLFHKQPKFPVCIVCVLSKYWCRHVPFIIPQIAHPGSLSSCLLPYMWAEEAMNKMRHCSLRASF